MQLTKQQRDALPDSAFGLPDSRSYPMPDKEHVRKAVQMFDYASDSDRVELAIGIVNKAKSFGMDWENWDNIKSYLPSNGVTQESTTMNNKLIKVNNFPFSKVYKGSPVDFVDYVKESNGCLFVTPYIGIASIFTADKKEYDIPKGSCNISYDEWMLPLNKLTKPFSEVHVELQGFPSVKPHDVRTTGFIYTFDIDELGLRDNIYRFDWMDPEREFLIVKDPTNAHRLEKFPFVDKQQHSILNHIVGAECQLDQFKQEQLSQRFEEFPLNSANVKRYDNSNFEIGMKHCKTGDAIEGVILVDNGVAAGYVGVETKPDGKWISALEVSKSYQHQGLGKILLNQYAISRFGAEKLSVNKDNMGALKLYEDNGWEIFETTKTMYFMNYRKDANSVSVVEQDQFAASEYVQELYEFWSSCEYGIPGTAKMETSTFAKDYKFLSPNEFSNYKKGVCWDFVEYGRDFLSKHNVKFMQYYIQTNMNPGYCPTHTFIVCNTNNGMLLYAESAFGTVDKLINGVKLFRTLDEIVKLITESMYEPDVCGENYGYDLYSFNDHPPYGCSCDEYMDWMYDNAVLLKNGYVDCEVLKSSTVVQEASQSRKSKERRNMQRTLLRHGYDPTTKTIEVQYKDGTTEKIPFDTDDTWTHYSATVDPVDKFPLVSGSTVKPKFSNMCVHTTNSMLKKHPDIAGPVIDHEIGHIRTLKSLGVLSDAIFPQHLETSVHCSEQDASDESLIQAFMQRNPTELSADEFMADLDAARRIGYRKMINALRTFVTRPNRYNLGAELIKEEKNTITKNQCDAIIKRALNIVMEQKARLKRLESMRCDTVAIPAVENEINTTMHLIKTLEHPLADPAVMKTIIHNTQEALQDSEKRNNLCMMIRIKFLQQMRRVDQSRVNDALVKESCSITSDLGSQHDIEFELEYFCSTNDISTDPIVIQEMAHDILLHKTFDVLDQEFMESVDIDIAIDEDGNRFTNHTPIVYDDYDRLVSFMEYYQPTQKGAISTMNTQTARFDDGEGSGVVQEAFFEAGFGNLRSRIMKALGDNFTVSSIKKQMGKAGDRFDIENKTVAEPIVKVEGTGTGVKIVAKHGVSNDSYGNNVPLSTAYSKLLRVIQELFPDQVVVESLDPSQFEEDDLTIDAPIVEPDCHNEYDETEVETLNNLVASELAAMDEYFTAAKDSSDQTLQRLYSDIGAEERFHSEQLLYAKSVLTGEKYEPRDPKVKDEYQELLDSGMDEETALATVSDKMALSIDPDDFDDDELKTDTEVLEFALRHLATLACTMEAAFDESVDVGNKTVILENCVDAFHMEGVDNAADGNNPAVEIHPLRFIIKTFKTLFKFIVALIAKIKTFVKRVIIKQSARNAWIKSHGIKGLFASGVSLYFYSEKNPERISIEPMRYVDLMDTVTRALGVKSGMTDPGPIDNRGIYEPIRVHSIEQGLNMIKGVTLTKTKIIVTDVNADSLAKIFFGYNAAPGPSNNIYNQLDGMCSFVEIYNKRLEAFVNKLDELEKDAHSIYYTNRREFSKIVKATSVIAKGYNVFATALAHDMNAIIKLNNGMLEETRQKDAGKPDQQAKQQQGAQKPNGGIDW